MISRCEAYPPPTCRHREAGCTPPVPHQRSGRVLRTGVAADHGHRSDARTGPDGRLVPRTRLRRNVGHGRMSRCIETRAGRARQIGTRCSVRMAEPILSGRQVSTDRLSPSSMRAEMAVARESANNFNCQRNDRRGVPGFLGRHSRLRHGVVTFRRDEPSGSTGRNTRGISRAVPGAAGSKIDRIPRADAAAQRTGLGTYEERAATHVESAGLARRDGGSNPPAYTNASGRHETRPGGG